MKIKELKQKIQVVTIAENQLLLLQFAKDHNQGFQNITGSVEYDESFLEAARRELVEEIGVAENVIDIHHSFFFQSRWGDDVEEKVFLFHPSKIPHIQLSSEHQSFKWIPLNEVTAEHFSFVTNYEAFLKAWEFVR